MEVFPLDWIAVVGANPTQHLP